MALVDLRDMIQHAYKNSYAVGAFDLVSLDFLEAVIGAAERSRAPVILSVAEPHFSYYDLELMMPAVEAAAKRATVPVAIQLDHGSSLESAVNAIRHGCNGLMLDASQKNLPDNISATKTVVDMAHLCGVPVVGSVGHVAESANGNESLLTLPSEAKAFVERTGVDFLSVSIGTTQGQVKGKAKLDIKRLKQLHQELNVPLVIHGGTGLNEDQSRRMTSLGVAKINYFTGLSEVAAKAMQQQMKKSANASFIDLKKDVKHAIGEDVERCLRLWGSAGRAAEVMAQCALWLPVKHLVMYNVSGDREHDTEVMMAEGKRVLANIPGVREVFAGEVVEETESRYRYCWLIKFASQTVVNSYQANENKLAFKESFFQRLVGASFSIDFKVVSPRADSGFEIAYGRRYLGSQGESFSDAS